MKKLRGKILLSEEKCLEISQLNVTNDELKLFERKEVTKNSFPPRGQILATTCYFTRYKIVRCVCFLSQCGRDLSESNISWACGANSETCAKWWIGDKLNMDISLLFRFEIPQRLENISDVVESSAWAHHKVADPHRPFRVKCKILNEVLPSHRTRQPDTIHWWCLVQLLPLHWAHSGLENQFLCGEASLLLQVFSEAILRPLSTLSRYKSNCGRLLQHHQFQFYKPPTRRGFQKVFLILTSGFLLV